MACGNVAQEKLGSHTVEEVSKMDSVEMVDSSIQSLISREVAPSIINVADSAFISEKLTELNAKYYSEWCEGRE